MKTVVINNNTVAIKPINFGAICDLEELGFDAQSMRNKTFSSIRCAVAYNMDISLEEAAAEIENHVKNGGKINDFIPLLEAIIQSDFFTDLAKNAKEDN